MREILIPWRFSFRFMSLPACGQFGKLSIVCNEVGDEGGGALFVRHNTDERYERAPVLRSGMSPAQRVFLGFTASSEAQ